ncbi:hypothetical protein V8G54_030189 [Vigna mungo]|uniref:Uncharacterized protein n=1 Tax=Vigna mungo TaxID=3915 RepID=A0AAQ3RML0_VIGMU
MGVTGTMVGRGVFSASLFLRSYRGWGFPLLSDAGNCRKRPLHLRLDSHRTATSVLLASELPRPPSQKRPQALKPRCTSPLQAPPRPPTPMTIAATTSSPPSPCHRAPPQQPRSQKASAVAPSTTAMARFSISPTFIWNPCFTVFELALSG